MKLSAEAVRDVAMYILYKPEEVVDGKTPDGAIIVKGIIHDYGFHPDRLNDKRETINEMLKEMDDAFWKDRGGGWSFLKGAFDRHGRQWGEHRDVEALVVFGIAIGKASWQGLEMRSVLPGGVPYFEVHPDEA